MASTKTISNVEIRNTVTETGTAVAVTGKPFTVAIVTDLDAALDFVVEASHDETFDDIWTLDDSLALEAQSIGSDITVSRPYDGQWQHVLVLATARTSPSGGDIDVYIIRE